MEKLTHEIINQINKKINYTYYMYRNYEYEEIKEMYYYYAAVFTDKYNKDIYKLGKQGVRTKQSKKKKQYCFN